MLPCAQPGASHYNQGIVQGKARAAVATFSPSCLALCSPLHLSHARQPLLHHPALFILDLLPGLALGGLGLGACAGNGGSRRTPVIPPIPQLGCLL